MKHKHSLYRSGFTLVEILVVIAIILILVSGIITVGSKVRLDGQIKNTEGVIHTLSAALEEYRRVKETHSGRFIFPLPPLDPDMYSNGTYDATLDPPVGGVRQAIVHTTGGQVEILNEGSHGSFTWDDKAVLEEAGGDYDQVFYRKLARASMEVLYTVLDSVPECRAILNKLPQNMVTNDDDDFVRIDGREVPLLEVNDAWGHPLLYQYEPDSGNFPLITSAGPDGLFFTADDIRLDEI